MLLLFYLIIGMAPIQLIRSFVLILVFVLSFLSSLVHIFIEILDDRPLFAHHVLLRNILGGGVGAQRSRVEVELLVGSLNALSLLSSKIIVEDVFRRRLKGSFLDCIRPLISFSSFWNLELNVLVVFLLPLVAFHSIASHQQCCSSFLL